MLTSILIGRRGKTKEEERKRIDKKHKKKNFWNDSKPPTRRMNRCLK